MRPTHPSRRLLILATAGAVALGACSDSSGINVQTFTVTLSDTPQTTKHEDGSVVSVIGVVVDTDAGHVIGASIRYAVSTGALSATTGVSGANGLATVTWTLTGEQAAAQTNPTFSACSDSEEPAACTPAVLATLHLDAVS
jgi:hypothetical protein